MAILLILILGVCTGLRTMTPIAVISWFAYARGGAAPALPLAGWRHFLSYLPAAVIFSLFAIGEYIGDKLPNTPSRTSPMGIAARTVFGIVMGVILAPTVHASPVVAGLAGGVGAVLGTYGGWFVRTKLAAAVGKDWPIANVEDWIAIAVSILVMNVITQA